MAFRTLFLIIFLAISWTAFCVENSEERRILVVTYNVGKRKPPLGVDISELLGQHMDPKPDLIVIGLQEIPTKPLKYAMALIGKFVGLNWNDGWSKVIEQNLSNFGYNKVERLQMSRIVMLVFASRDFAKNIHSLDNNRVKTGFGGLLPNKGAVKLSMMYKNTSIALINSHLAANEGEFEQRLDDYFKIKYNGKFKERPLNSHKLIFWFGDLNFRLNAFDSKTVIDMLRTSTDNSTISELLKYDELKIAMADQLAFNGFKEAKITFRPSYKFIVGSRDIYDVKRKPAWTDRILYKVKKSNHLTVEQHNYEAYFDLCISDHKPVSSLFVVRLN